MLILSYFDNHNSLLTNFQVSTPLISDTVLRVLFLQHPSSFYPAGQLWNIILQYPKIFSVEKKLLIVAGRILGWILKIPGP